MVSSSSSALAKRRRTSSFAFLKWRRISPSAFFKRRRTSTRSRPRRGQLLCIPCYHMCEKSKGTFHIYLVDLTSTAYSVGDALCPALSIDAEYFKVDTLCVLGSKLYLFPSSHRWDDNSDSEWVSDATSVGTVNLSKYLTKKNVKLGDDRMGHIKPMLCPKRFPIATPTPGGKILVFSTHIQLRTACSIDFELYDPSTRQWKPLPRLYDNWDMHRKHSCYSMTVESFAFIRDNLLIETHFGMFELDLESSSGGWRDLDITLARKVPCPCRASLLSVVEGGLCFCPRFAFDIDTPKDSSQCCFFPLGVLNWDDGFKVRGVCGIIETLGGDDGDCNYCIVETVINEHTGYPHLAIYVYRCDLAKYRDDKQNLIAKHMEDMGKLDAKYIKDKQELVEANNYSGDEEDNDKTAAIKKLEREYGCGKKDLELEDTSQLSTRLEKSFQFVLDTQKKCKWSAPLSLAFVLPGTNGTT